MFYVPEFYSFLVPEEDLTAKDVGFVKSLHGLAASEGEISDEDMARLDALATDKYKVQYGQAPDGGVISALCQIFYYD